MTNRNFSNLLITAINLENVMNTAKNQDTTATAEFPTWPGSQYLNNIKTVLDSPQSARALLLNYEQRSRLAKVKWGFFNSIPRLSIVSILRRFVLDIDERHLRRAIVKRGI